MKSAKEIYKEHYYKNFNTNRDDEPMDWEIDAMNEIASQSKWITIDINDPKTLPPVGEKFLGSDGSYVSIYGNAENKTDIEHLIIINDLIEWQPLPAPSNNNKV